MRSTCTQACLKLGLLGALVFFCSNSFLWRKKLWEVSVERLGSDLPKTTMHSGGTRAPGTHLGIFSMLRL